MKIQFTALLALVLSFQSLTLTAQENNSNNKLLMATLYNYYAAEYKALAYQAFNIGEERLAAIRKADPVSRNLAVVVDLDETMLDNTPFEANLMLSGGSFSENDWNQWCAMGEAEAVPGALEFLNYADSLGFTIFYISNRKDKYTREGTIENLQKLSFPQLNDENIILRTGPRDKESRREKVSEQYNIVLLAGDNIGDFYQDTLLFSAREQAVLVNKENFGRKFIVLPNAIYGDWPASINLPGTENTADSLLRIIARPYLEKE